MNYLLLKVNIVIPVKRVYEYHYGLLLYAYATLILNITYNHCLYKILFCDMFLLICNDKFMQLVIMALPQTIKMLTENQTMNCQDCVFPFETNLVEIRVYTDL